MKKLLTLITAVIMLAGCSSSDDSTRVIGKVSGTDIKLEEKNEDPKGKEADEKKENENEEQNTEIASSGSNTSSESENTTTEKSNNKSTQSSSESSSTVPKEENKTTSSTNESKPNNQGKTEESKPTETPPPVESQPAPPTNQQAKADQVFAQINAYRVQNGLEPFVQSDFLKNRCNSHALEMANAEALWHSGNAAECITNYDDPFSAWINSPPHKEILMCNNSQAAVGIYYYNGYYYSVFQTRV